MPGRFGGDPQHIGGFLWWMAKQEHFAQPLFGGCQTEGRGQIRYRGGFGRRRQVAYDEQKERTARKEGTKPGYAGKAHNADLMCVIGDWTFNANLRIAY